MRSLGDELTENRIRIYELWSVVVNIFNVDHH